MKPPPIQWIPVFEAAARYLSFKKAADELNVTQPAISQQIKALEDYLDIKLFKRRGPRLELTEAGETYFQSAKTIVKAHSSGFGEFDRRYNKRSLRLNTPLFIAQELLIPNYMAFRDKEPKAELRITTGSEYIDFQADTADAAIRVGIGEWPELQARCLCRFDTAPICAPSIFKDEWADPKRELIDTLNAQTIISTNDSLVDWRRLYPEIEPKEVLVCDSYFSAIKSAEQGLGITLGIFPAINHWMNSQRLRLIRDEIFETQSAYWLVYPRENESNELIASCFDWAKALFEQLPPLVRY